MRVSQLAELDELTELQYQLEEDMSNAEERVVVKDEALKRKKAERQQLEKTVRSLEKDRDKLKYEIDSFKSDIASKDRCALAQCIHLLNFARSTPLKLHVSPLLSVVHALCTHHPFQRRGRQAAQAGDTACRRGVYQTPHR
eukprot:SAG11_NODE_1006_length_6209_cov_3.553846_2_plen_141_part_00